MIRPEDCFVEPIPPDPDAHFGWRIKRTPPGQVLNMYCISSQVFGTRTHYFRRRTVPHLRKNCEACAAHNLSRWTGYILASEHGSGDKILFEFTPPAAICLHKIAAERGTLRGLKLQAGRVNNRPNGKVTIRSLGPCDRQDDLPDEEAILPILFHIWGLSDQQDDDPGNVLEKALSEQEAYLLDREPPATAIKRNGSCGHALDLPGQRMLPVLAQTDDPPSRKPTKG